MIVVTLRHDIFCLHGSLTQCHSKSLIKDKFLSFIKLSGRNAVSLVVIKFIIIVTVMFDTLWIFFIFDNHCHLDIDQYKLSFLICRNV